jgi:hypothetical protein
MQAQNILSLMRLTLEACLRTVKRPITAHLAMCVLAIGIGGFTAVNSLQDINFDLRNYHYSGPYEFLHGRLSTDYNSGGLETYENPLADIPGYLFISHASPRAAAGMLGMLQGVNIWLVFEIGLLLIASVKARMRYKVLIVALIAIASFFGAGNASEVGNTMGDNIVGIAVLSALGLMLASVRPKEQRGISRLRIAAFVVMGIAMALKLTNVIYGVGLLAASLLLNGSLVWRLKRSVVCAGCMIVGLLVAGGFWYVKLWTMFKNPIFPYYNHLFKSPYYQSINFTDTRWHPHSVAQAIFYPFSFWKEQSFVSELPFKDPRLAILYVLLMLVAVVWLVYRLVLKKRWPARGLWSKRHTIFFVFLILSYALWVKQFSYYRYLIPTELLSIVAIMALIYVLIDNFRVATGMLAIVVVFILLHTTAIDWGRTAWRPTYFGVTKSDFMPLNNSTVLMGGYQPFAFLIPYFPESSATIRIGSDLSSPESGTATMQNLLRNKVQQRQQQHTPFYAIVADEEVSHSEQQFAAYGFQLGSCKELPLYFRENYDVKYRLCTLEGMYKDN